MSVDSPEFLQRLRATFRIEADEHLQAMSSLLLELEQPAPGVDPAPRLEALFREAHSLKGAARAVDEAGIEQVCQAMERVLGALKRQDGVLSPPLFDALHRALDGVARMLGGAPADPAATRALVDALLQPAPAAAAPPALAPAAPSAATLPPSETVRIAVPKLETLLVQAEELLAHKFGAEQLADELAELRALLLQSKRDADKRARQARAMRRAAGAARDSVGLGRQQRMLAQLLEAIERDETQARLLHDRVVQLERLAAQERRALAARVDHLLDDMKQVLMLPFSTLLEGVPKLVRDLAHDAGKDVELQLSGTAIEIDRRILEQMKTPLIHLVRNAVDHGIETPQQRRRSGKPPRGRITIEVTPQESNKVELVVADDGRGIDLAGVRAQAERMGLLRADAAGAASAHDALPLVFESGLSTRSRVSDISGHGLGLAIVREKVEKLGGTIALDAPQGAGARFSIVLPATLATLRGLLVAVGERQFVLPVRHVERVVRIEPKAVTTVHQRETLELDGATLAFVRLADVLRLPRSVRRDDAPLPVAVLSAGGKRMAFAIDEVLGDQEVLVKPLGPLLKRVPNVAAATVLGAGRLVPMLEVADLMKSALRTPAPAQAPRPAAAPRRSVLVVEDSITSRALLKGILESAGYEVDTAVDGMDALSRLREGGFDLVVSDVEMPRLDGFGLTARLRADTRWARLPVVLVTALGSPADRERGIDAGANAYIVKSSFDQSNLLEVIGGLL
jgi:two-component system chemotaxis sensor kinase CheA